MRFRRFFRRLFRRRPKPAYYDAFMRTCEQPNVSNVNDCSNKAGELMRFMHKNGDTAAEIVVCSQGKGLPQHAIVRLYDNFYDPAFGTISDRLPPGYEYLYSIWTIAALDQWGAEFKSGEHLV